MLFNVFWPSVCNKILKNGGVIKWKNGSETLSKVETTDKNRAFENKDVIVSCNLFFTHPVLNSKQMWRTDIWICGAWYCVRSSMQRLTAKYVKNAINLLAWTQRKRWVFFKTKAERFEMHQFGRGLIHSSSFLRPRYLIYCFELFTLNQVIRFLSSCFVFLLFCMVWFVYLFVCFNIVRVKVD